jgi:hypothetical protein
MAFSTLPTAANIPIGSDYDPATNTFPALQGSPLKNVDTFSNTSAPLVVGDQLQAAIMNGKGYVATTGLFATLTNGNLIMGLSVFNPLAGGKSLYIYSIKFSSVTSSSNLTIKYNLTTADPTLATTITAQNLRPGGAASTASCTSAANAATASIAVTGTFQDMLFANTLGTFELLTTPEAGIMLPASAANGVLVYGTVVTAAQNWVATIRYIEF